MQPKNASPSGRIRRYAYGASIAEFLRADPGAILGQLAAASEFSDELTQKAAWQEQIVLLKDVLSRRSESGAIYLEYAIPRLGRRVDSILLLRHMVFVLEFKVGAEHFTRAAVEQAWDYALDLKNFHEPSHDAAIAPVLIATRSRTIPHSVGTTAHHDQLLQPILTGACGMDQALDLALAFLDGSPITVAEWEQGRYRPTPTIVEAAKALYAGHAVEDITRSDACAQNLSLTSTRLSYIIDEAQKQRRKAICFVTGVPGAGKTLVGLDIANKHTSKDDELYSVFLSGNGPLVAVLHEALARDRVAREKAKGGALRVGEARSAVKQFIQNVHHFRDYCLLHREPPIEHVALFDEAQRAWTLAKTADFMARKKGHPGFDQSEPAFLVSCLNRHEDWAVVVCLVGSGQEINTGEAGISEWLAAMRGDASFKDWAIYVSPRLREIEYHADEELKLLDQWQDVHWDTALHLGTSVRSFRSERVSDFVNFLLRLELEQARSTLNEVLPHFPIRVTRDLSRAKQWLRKQARGSERFGMVVSSQAQRLKPHAIDVRVKIDPVRWFLEDREDVRSSYYLEDVATQFQVQGLELDWVCVVWDGDLRLQDGSWNYYGFKGKRWERVRKAERQRYMLNAYRVLMTRARQGMVLVVPYGDPDDPSRAPHYYDPAFEILTRIGVPTLDAGMDITYSADTPHPPRKAHG